MLQTNKPSTTTSTIIVIDEEDINKVNKYDSFSFPSSSYSPITPSELCRQSSESDFIASPLHANIMHNKTQETEKQVLFSPDTNYAIAHHLSPVKQEQRANKNIENKDEQKITDEISSTKPLQGGYAIFVGNLDQHTHEDKIREKLELYGIDISSMTAKKPSTKQSSFPMFYLFVNLTSPEDVNKAVNILNRKRIGTSIVTVSARDNDKQKIETGSRIIHIGNMPHEYSGEPLVHMLARLGIHLKESDFKLLRNHAFIRLLNQDSTIDVLAELQVSINKMYRSDRKITVEIARCDPWLKSNRNYNKYQNTAETKIKSDFQQNGSILKSMVVLQMQPTHAQIQAQIQVQAQAQLQAQVQIQAAQYNLQLQQQKQQYLQQLYAGNAIPQLLYYPSTYSTPSVNTPTNIPQLFSVPYAGIRSTNATAANAHLFLNPLSNVQNNGSVSVLTSVPFHAHGISAAARFNPLTGNRIF